jgi:hypothetical protein
MTLDISIAEHLRKERTLPVNTPSAGFQPPYPSYSVRFPEKAAGLVMAVIGAQYKSEAQADGSAQQIISRFVASPGSEEKPTWDEWASVTDNKGYYNLSLLVYWSSNESYDSWAEKSGFRQWWASLDPSTEKHGWFLEVFFPTMDRFETLFNTQTTEASAHMKEAWSGEVQQHGYWGSMRDRLPIAQTEEIPGQKATAADFRAPSATAASGRLRIPGRKNLAIIRSGQDWSVTTPEERELYLAEMHPVLIKGMDFLRDQGSDVGCFSCRFMDVLDPTTFEKNRERTFGLAYFDDLASLESWCKEHPTHLAIFGGFMKYAKKLGMNVMLRVYHEVLVLEPEQQLFEYVGCHAGTGMLVTHKEDDVAA